MDKRQILHIPTGVSTRSMVGLSSAIEEPVQNVASFAP
jgi:hypothetical protein